MLLLTIIVLWSYILGAGPLIIRYSIALSDSENNTIMIVEIVVFTIVNTITIVSYQFFNTMIINKEA